ncbi:cytochrome b [Microvirga terricola]|uniref:Cytochrome B n=1 Tax=Microvirga terricola TaxID=2719797 RepID=A0ABX0V7G4_9HYPH|nr:cytochrome b/b6 domain-containing protein [Microvirga terricola]NIX75788.1 cytochrome B [Microvirga terricola]
MALKGSFERYGAVAVASHWLSAALILALIPLGFLMQDATGETRLIFYRIHVLVGVVAGMLTLFRLLWWAAFDHRPAPLAASRAQHMIARITHVGLYAVLIALVVSGVAMTAKSNLGAGLVSGDVALISPSPIRVPPRLAHGVAARLLLALLVLHLAGALYHHWMKRDETLSRMLPRTR